MATVSDGGMQLYRAVVEFVTDGYDLPEKVHDSAVKNAIKNAPTMRIVSLEAAQPEWRPMDEMQRSAK